MRSGSIPDSSLLWFDLPIICSTDHTYLFITICHHTSIYSLEMASARYSLNQYLMNNVLLDLLALGAILSGIMVITAKNPVISVLFLISVFINVAGYLVLLGVAYLGLVYLIVYVGAIAILFLFVIMMLNLRLVELVDTGQEYTKNLPIGAFLGSLFFFELLSILPVSYQDGGSLHVPLNFFN